MVHLNCHNGWFPWLLGRPIIFLFHSILWQTSGSLIMELMILDISPVVLGWALFGHFVSLSVHGVRVFFISKNVIVPLFPCWTVISLATTCLLPEATTIWFIVDTRSNFCLEDKITIGYILHKHRRCPTPRINDNGTLCLELLPRLLYV